jgi:lactate permease
VINAVWIYNLTVASGHFEVLRLSFEKVSPDQRIQAIIIAFCFGALLEALAGFGTPVAISVVMLMSLGFKPVKAATVALVANTAPVAFGALAIPIVTLAPIAAGVSNDPRLSDANALGTLGSMVGRQTPILALFVPLILVLIVDGRRGVRQTWAAGHGGGHGVRRRPVRDGELPLRPAHRHRRVAAVGRLGGPAGAGVAAGRGADGRAGQRGGACPRGCLQRVRAGGRRGGATATRGAGVGAGLGAEPAAGSGAGRPSVDNRGDVVRAYAPYLVIIVIFSITNIPSVVDYLAKAPWTYLFDWPGLDILNAAGDPVPTQFKFNWLPAAGTLLIIAGLITMVILKVSPARALQTYGETLVELRSAIITVMAVLGLAYVMNLSGQTTSLGVWLAGSGGAFALISPILGWIGVAVTGSDTSSNSLFGALQVQAATKAGLDPVLMAAANSSGGVLGKMVSPQNLAIAAAAVGLSGNEGVIFRKVIGWSLLLLVLMCAIVGCRPPLCSAGWCHSHCVCSDAWRQVFGSGLDTPGAADRRVLP